MVKFWPFANSFKEMLFLNELEEIFDYLTADDVLALVNPLAGKLANCVKTCHFQVGVVCIQLAIRGTHCARTFAADCGAHLVAVEQP